MFAEHSIIIGHQMQLLTLPWEMEEQTGHGVFSSLHMLFPVVVSHSNLKTLASAFPAVSWNYLPSSRLQYVGEEREPLTVPTKLRLCFGGPSPRPFALQWGWSRPLAPPWSVRKWKASCCSLGELGSLSHTGYYRYSLTGHIIPHSFISWKGACSTDSSWS